MNILFATHRSYTESKGGTEVLVEDLARELRDRGNNLTILFVSDQLHGEDYRVDSMNEKGLLRVAISSEKQKNPVDDWKSVEKTQAAKIDKALKFTGISYDIVHIFHIARIGLEFINLDRLRRVPVFFTLTDYTLVCPDYQLYQRKVGKMCNRMSYNISCTACLDYEVSNKQVDEWIKRNINIVNSIATKIYVQTNYQRDRLTRFGVSSSKISRYLAQYKTPDIWAENFRENTNRFTFGFLGRISPEKAPHIIIEAFKSLDKEDCKLLICGEADDEQYYHTIINSIKGFKNIYYNPPVSLEELGEIIKQIDCLLFPSCWCENKSLLITYSCSLGIPALCSEVPSLTEYSSSSIEFISNYTDVHAWTTAMKRKICDKSVLPPTIDSVLFKKSQELFFDYVSQIYSDYTTVNPSPQ